MDAFAYHPYMERADLPPTCRHVRSKTLTIADYGKLVSVLKRAFDGTKQKGATLPLVYDEFGVEAQVPAAQRASYSGTRAARPRTRSARRRRPAYYEQGFHLAACQPTVRTIMVFRLIDSEFLASFQSGVYYADRKTPKSSLPAVAAAATQLPSRTISRLRGAARADAGGRLADAHADLRRRLRLRRDVPPRRLVGAGRDDPRDGARRRRHQAAAGEAEARPLPDHAARDRDRLQGERVHGDEPAVRIGSGAVIVMLTPR